MGFSINEGLGPLHQTSQQAPIGASFQHHNTLPGPFPRNRQLFTQTSQDEVLFHHRRFSRGRGRCFSAQPAQEVYPRHLLLHHQPRYRRPGLAGLQYFAEVGCKCYHIFPRSSLMWKYC